MWSFCYQSFRLSRYELANGVLGRNYARRLQPIAKEICRRDKKYSLALTNLFSCIIIIWPINLERWQSPVECTRLEIEQASENSSRGFESLSLRHECNKGCLLRKQEAIFFGEFFSIFKKHSCITLENML